MSDIYQTLEDLQIKYEKHDHPAVFTCEDADKYYININGGHSKNLFLRDKKGKQHYLVTIESNKRADLKKLAEALNEQKLSFASPERLLKHLGLTPGSVSPFGLINNEANDVEVIVDEDILKHEQLAYHPNTNTATLVISTEDFKKFLDFTGNNWRKMEIPLKE